MKNLITATCITALLSTQSLAVVEEQKPEPPVVSVAPVTEERSEPSSNNDGAMLAVAAALLAVAAVKLGLVIYANTRPRLDTPRPLVQPQTCMNKHAVIVACDDE